MTAGALDGMETLAARATYDDDELGITRRLPLYAGVFFGVWMGVVSVVDSLLTGRSLPALLGSAVAAVVLNGVALGLLFPLLLWWMARRINDRLYAGDPRLVPPPPVGRYTYRLPCVWRRTPKLGVYGVLYLGPGGLRFDPLLRYRARHRESLLMEPLDGITVHLVEAPVPSWLRLWGRRTVPRFEVHWGAGRVAQFSVPETAAVFPRVQETVDRLQRQSRDDPH